MSRLGILAYGVAVTITALLTAREAIDASVYVFQELASGMLALAVVGWLIASLGPLALSIWFWRLSRKLRPSWALHLLFIPCAVAVYQAGASLLFFATDVPDGDSIEGYTLTAAFGFLLLTLLVHTVALTAVGITRISRRASVR